MRKPLWKSLIADANHASGSAPLKNFIGMCYIEGDGIDEDVEQGLTGLLEAATNENSSELVLAEARENCMREYKLADKRISLELPPGTVQEWVLDGVFRLAAGYWFCVDQPVHQLKLKMAKQSFFDALESIDEGEIDRILVYGFAVYMAERPSEQESTLRKMNGLALEKEADDYTRFARIAVFSVDSEFERSLEVKDIISLNLLWDLRLVRGLAHFGYEDSIRLLYSTKSMSNCEPRRFWTGKSLEVNY